VRVCGEVLVGGLEHVCRMAPLPSALVRLLRLLRLSLSAVLLDRHARKPPPLPPPPPSPTTHL